MFAAKAGKKIRCLFYFQNAVRRSIASRAQNAEKVGLN
jgi:hypothetical protein